jgi:hypothetical protein
MSRSSIFYTGPEMQLKLSPHLTKGHKLTVKVYQITLNVGLDSSNSYSLLGVDYYTCVLDMRFTVECVFDVIFEFLTLHMP